MLPSLGGKKESIHFWGSDGGTKEKSALKIQHLNRMNDIKGITKAQSLHREARDLGHNDLRRNPRVSVSVGIRIACGKLH